MAIGKIDNIMMFITSNSVGVLDVDPFVKCRCSIRSNILLSSCVFKKYALHNKFNKTTIPLVSMLRPRRYALDWRDSQDH